MSGCYAPLFGDGTKEVEPTYFQVGSSKHRLSYRADNVEIDNSHNVSSFTDSSAGDATTNITSPYAAVDNALGTMCGLTNAVVHLSFDTSPFDTTGVHLTTIPVTGSPPAPGDCQHVCHIGMGDLA